MQKKFLKLNDISTYKKALALSNYVWQIVINWEWFAKQTIGSQYAKAVDSISANIAEGFGRYFKKDKIRFYNISYGSITESSDWTQKAKERNLLKKKEYDHILKELNELPREINHLINFTESKLKR